FQRVPVRTDDRRRCRDRRPPQSRAEHGYANASGPVCVRGVTGLSSKDRRGRAMTGKPLIESDRGEGTYVYDPHDNHIGTNTRLVVEKNSGQVSSAVSWFGGIFGLGEQEYSIPWSKLQYDVNLSGYRTDITEQDLKSGKYR